FAWNPAGAGLIYLQSAGGAAPAGRGGRGGRGNAGGASGANAPGGTTRVVLWSPPFGANDTKVLYEGTSRLSSVAYSADGKTMFVADSGTVFALRVADPSKKFNLGRGVTIPSNTGGFGGGGRGAATPDSVLGGALVMKRGADGEQVVVLGSDDRTVF